MSSANAGNVSATVTFRDCSWDGRSMLNPDTMTLAKIGKARSPRGVVVRAFFWLLKAWPT